MRLLRRRRLRWGDESGSQLIEIAVAVLVLAVAITGVVGVMGAGMGLVGHSRQRSAGAGVAQERLERAHNIPYEDVALNEQPTHVATPEDHPDKDVSADGTTYKGEPLVIDLANGGLRHVDDPFTLANTEFTVHQYVTWVTDPEVSDTEPSIAGNQSYKRITVVVKWKFPVQAGPSHTVTESTFVSRGTVTGPTPTPVATPTPAAGAGGTDTNLGVGGSVGDLTNDPNVRDSQCAADVTRPAITEMLVLSGSGTERGYLNSTSVEIRFAAGDTECNPLDVFMKNEDVRENCTNSVGYVDVGNMTGEIPPPFNVTWTIPAGDGVKSICAYVRSKDLRTSAVWAAAVKLDQTKPTVPASFAQQSCTISGTNRTVAMHWTTSSDTNLYGHRLYRSIESNAFQLVQQTTSTSISDTAPKNYSSVRYLVRGYDKAGNESQDPPVLSYSKNSC